MEERRWGKGREIYNERVREREREIKSEKVKDRKREREECCGIKS